MGILKSLCLLFMCVLLQEPIEVERGHQIHEN